MTYMKHIARVSKPASAVSDSTIGWDWGKQSGGVPGITVNGVGPLTNWGSLVSWGLYRVYPLLGKTQVV